MDRWLKDCLEGKSALASARVGGERLEVRMPEKREGRFVLRETAQDVELRLEGEIFSGVEAASWCLYVRNTGAKDSPQISRLRSADIMLRAEPDQRITWEGINGDRCSEENFLPFRREMTDGCSFRAAPNGGRPSNGEFPMFDLRTPDGGWIVSIGWSGQWLLELSRQAEGVCLGIGLEDADFYLHPGEEVRLARVLVKAYEGDPVEGHNAYRRLLFERFSPRTAQGGRVTLPAAIQCFDRYSMKMDYWNTEEGQKDYAARAKKLEYLDTVWMDAAWFKGGFPFGVGNYGFRAGLPNGLRPVSDAVREMGMRFMLWFEPERIVYGSQTDTEHPEWVIRLPDPRVWGPGKRQDRDVAEPAPSGLYNLGIPEAREALTKRIADFIRAEGIDVFRQDFNIDPLPFWRSCDEPGRNGLCEIRYVMGFYRFWDDLLETFPGLLIDNCASGGRRIDLETCMRSVPLWRSDTGCSPIAPGRPSDLWNQNQCVSLSGYLAYHSISSWNYGAYEFRSAATNGIAAQFAVFDDGFDFDAARVCLAEFDRLKRYWLGDFYPLTETRQDDTVWAAWQLHCAEDGSGLVMAFRRGNSPYRTAVFSLRRVERGARYRLRISDEHYHVTERLVSGAELADGLEITLDAPHTSTAVQYEVAKDE